MDCSSDEESVDDEASAVTAFSLEDAQAKAEEIQRNPGFKILNLEDRNIGPRKRGGGLPQVQVLAAGLRASSVTMLGLTTTGLGNEGVRSLATVLRETSIEILDLGDNYIGDDGALDLADGLRASRVTDLLLYDNKIGDEGAKALAAILKESALQHLDLNYNDINLEGVKAFAAALRDSSLSALRLQGAAIDVEGAEALLEGLRDSSVVVMDLEECPFGAEIQLVVEANRDRSFILQIEAQKVENKIKLKFRTLAGSEAAVLTWSLDRPAEELPQDVWRSIRSSGFQLPCKGLSVDNLRFVLPDGAILDVGWSALPLAQQLGLATEPQDEGGALSSRGW